MTEWVLYESLSAGFVIARPAAWDVFEDVGEALVVLRAHPSELDRFLPNLNVVIVEDEEIDRDLDRFAVGVTAQHQRTLTDALVLDVGEALLAGCPARRVLCSYRQGIFSVTLEQWLTLGENGVVVLSASSSTLDYPACRGTFERMVSSFGVGPSA